VLAILADGSDYVFSSDRLYVLSLVWMQGPVYLIPVIALVFERGAAQAKSDSIPCEPGSHLCGCDMGIFAFIQGKN